MPTGQRRNRKRRTTRSYGLGNRRSNQIEGYPPIESTPPERQPPQRSLLEQGESLMERRKRERALERRFRGRLPL